MKIKAALPLSIFVILLPAIAYGQLTAEEGNRRNSQAQAASAAAQELATRSQWKDAETRLQDAERQCGTDASTRQCRLLLNYSLGYVAQQQGNTDQARVYYRKVLAESPANGASLNNLALVEEAARHDSEAEALWTKAILADPDHAGQWALQLGDHYSHRAQYAEALRQYHAAASKLPEAETPRRRIVEVYVRMPDSALDQLAGEALSWETSFPSTTRIAYELLIKRGFNGASSDQVLLRWISLIAQHDRVTKESLAIVPANWKPLPVGELRTYLENPARPGFKWAWWQQSPVRTSAALELASAVGKQMLRETHEASRTASCWETAVTWVISPDSLAAIHGPDETTTGLSVLLDLNQELASLYYHYPSLDADGTKLAHLINRLFDAKMIFIGQQDWEATQNYHTTLALLYADRGIWNPKPGTFYAAGAIYQLEAALRDADRRFQDPKQKFFQPLPELKEKLAEGYAQTNQPERAATQYLNATAAYLDVDALDAAQNTLTRAQALKSPSEATIQLAHILDTRQKLSHGTPVEISPEKTPWFYQPAAPVNQEFLKRQTFKISVDSALSTDAGAGAGQDSAVKAYQLAVQQQTGLVGVGDLVRWRRLESFLRTKTKVPAAQKPEQAVLPAQPPGKALPLTIPGHWRPTKVATDPQLSKAVQAIAVHQ